MGRKWEGGGEVNGRSERGRREKWGEVRRRGEGGMGCGRNGNFRSEWELPAGTKAGG